MADTDDDGFITLPPGLFDSGTFKLPPKSERPRVEREEIVFVQAVPGAPAVPPADTTEPPAVAAEVRDEISTDTRRELPDPYEAPLVDEPLVEEPAAVTAETPVVPPPAAAPASWRIVLPEGGEAVVRSVVLVGRNPAAFDLYPGAYLLPVADATQSVSKTHAAFEVDEQGLWVHDLNSTNGVWVVRGEEVTEAVPGRRVQVLDGSSVELGDYVLSVARR